MKKSLKEEINQARKNEIVKSEKKVEGRAPASWGDKSCTLVSATWGTLGILGLLGILTMIIGVVMMAMSIMPMGITVLVVGAVCTGVLLTSFFTIGIIHFETYCD